MAQAGLVQPSTSSRATNRTGDNRRRMADSPGTTRGKTSRVVFTLRTAQLKKTIDLSCVCFTRDGEMSGAIPQVLHRRRKERIFRSRRIVSQSALPTLQRAGRTRVGESPAGYASVAGWRRLDLAGTSRCAAKGNRVGRV